ncbi:membrane-associated tyrosine- and threonine-specific cdc2-inhibitory kinase [Anaeramoeba flamelloides]|uniref:Membrane-associated tyrosine- and threonine-specific cdc2-inhibitory kinase n=1 Tax=Anaeramoeba flamelloides TaxID=1746091 RepID=A0AAV7Z3W0_9EUKA|nr:membrane-associated tyrosine- and threonine-specific cdc2-inhibitory kinase [Anaeramoeba flamelloides]
MTNNPPKNYLVKPDPKRFASNTPTRKTKRKIETPKSPRSTNYSKKFQDYLQLYSRLGPINPENKEDVFNTCFTDGNEIGKGSFSIVTRKKFLRNNKTYALKRSHQYTKRSDRKRFVEEVFKNTELFEDSPKSLGSKFVVRMDAAFEEFGFLCIVSQYCNGGSLGHHLNTMLGKQQILPEQQIWEILTYSLLALDFIHSKGFVHMDIKPENILIHKNKYKVCDFGNMTKEGEEFEDGDSRYLAPNTLGGLFQYVPAKSTYDIYSLGATIYQLSVGDFELPSGGLFWQQLRNVTQETELPYKCERSKELKNVILKMMLVDENERATVAKLFEHKSIVKILKNKFGSNWDQTFSLQKNQKKHKPQLAKNKKTLRNKNNSTNSPKNNLFSKVRNAVDGIYSRIHFNKPTNWNENRNRNGNRNDNGNESDNNNGNNINEHDQNNCEDERNKENILIERQTFQNDNSFKYSNFDFFDKQPNENHIRIIENSLKNLNTNQPSNVKEQRIEKKRKNKNRHKGRRKGHHESKSKNKHKSKHKSKSKGKEKGLHKTKKIKKHSTHKEKTHKKKLKMKINIKLFEEDIHPIQRIRTHSKTNIVMNDGEYQKKLNSINKIKKKNKNTELENIVNINKNYQNNHNNNNNNNSNGTNENGIENLNNNDGDNKIKVNLFASSNLNFKNSNLMMNVLSSPTPKRRRGLDKKLACSRKLFDSFEKTKGNSKNTKKPELYLTDFDLDLDSIDQC